MATKVNPVTGALDYYEQALPSFRNKVINGGMKISQRGTTFSFAYNGTTAAYTLDRFKFQIANPDNYSGTVTQYSMSAAELNTTGHSKALKVLTGTAESAIANDEMANVQQKIEAQDLQDLQYGTASAKTVTLSFWVKSSITGTFAFTLYKPDTTARVINNTYTINTADTWEKKTISIVGDTDSSASIVNDNGTGLALYWGLASGSNYDGSSSTSWTNYSEAYFLGGHAQDGVITTAGADWYITGAQLEIGTSSTPFEHRPIGTELSLCQRYYEVITVGTGTSLGVYTSGAGVRFYTQGVKYTTEKRAQPSVTITANNSFWTVPGIVAVSASGAHTFTPQAANTMGHGAYSNRPVGNNTPENNHTYIYEDNVTHKADAEL